MLLKNQMKDKNVEEASSITLQAKGHQKNYITHN